MRNIFRLGVVGMLGMGVASIGQAASEGAMPMQMPAAGESQASAVSGTGVVRQVKPETGKVKISHEPIAALGWPAMTMNFRVRDKAVLEGIGPGDKVNFQLEKEATGMVVTRIEKTSQ